MLVDIQTTAEKGRVYTLAEPGGLRIEWKDKAPFIVPQGFKSDGASVPRFFWRLVFPKGDEKAIRAGFAHDWIYRNHPEGWTKAEADLMFYDLLLEDGVEKWRAWIAYQGVKWFGHLAWKTRGEC
jgi:hypothetical protein